MYLLLRSTFVARLKDCAEPVTKRLTMAASLAVMGLAFRCLCRSPSMGIGFIRGGLDARSA